MTSSSRDAQYLGRNLGRVAYATADESLTSPGDARRFPAYAKRRRIAFEFARKGEPYDLVVVTEMADLPFWIRQRDPKIVFDIPNAQLNDDRLLHNMGRGIGKYVAGQSSEFNLSWRRVVERMIARSDAVVCCSPEQAEPMLAINDNVHEILDSHFSIPLLAHEDSGLLNSAPIVVWEGLPSSLAAFDAIAEDLARVRNATGAEFHFVTDKRGVRYMNRFGAYNVESKIRSLIPGAVLIQWSPSSLASEFRRATVGIIPVDMRKQICVAKPENRLILMWRAGLPVLASATPAHVRTMRAAGLDDYCRTGGEWTEMLLQMVSDPEAEQRNRRLGGELVASEHTEDKWLARWDAVLESIQP